MKHIACITLLIFLSGCATSSPERLANADEYKKRSEEATRRAAAEGELMGTPENIEYINKANNEAVLYREKAYTAKYKDTWADFFMSLIFNL